jgi:phosphoribosylanthranilate isomerase
VTDVKLCGMVRAVDVAHAAALGVRYVGCVFADGPRQRTVSDAVALFASLDPVAGPRRAGVFASGDPTVLAAATGAAGLDVVQLHDDPDASTVAMVRARLRREVWAVVRCPDGHLPSHAAGLWEVADAVVLDAHVPGRLGGTGKTLPWRDLAGEIDASRAQARRPGRLVVAGGLTPDNVGEAIAALRPDVVDTSSGVESAPGIKELARMRAFVEAVAAADGAGADRPRPPRSS